PVSVARYPLDRRRPTIRFGFPGAGDDASVNHNNRICARPQPKPRVRVSEWLKIPTTVPCAPHRRRGTAVCARGATLCSLFPRCGKRELSEFSLRLSPLHGKAALTPG